MKPCALAKAPPGLQHREGTRVAHTDLALLLRSLTANLLLQDPDSRIALDSFRSVSRSSDRSSVRSSVHSSVRSSDRSSVRSQAAAHSSATSKLVTGSGELPCWAVALRAEESAELHTQASISYTRSLQEGARCPSAGALQSQSNIEF